MYQCIYPVETGSGASFEYAGADRGGRLIEEPWDFGLQAVAVTNNIKIYSKAAGLGSNLEMSEDIEITVFVTSSRIAFYCEKYDKGSTWWGIGGGALIALAITAASKAQAKKRTAGTVMVGHIRYEWLSSISCSRGEAWYDDNYIVLGYKDSNKVGWEVRLEFPRKKTNVNVIANQIVRKACFYKLAMKTEKSEREIAEFAEYAQSDLTSFKNLRYSYAPGGEEFRPNLNELQTPLPQAGFPKITAPPAAVQPAFLSEAMPSSPVPSAPLQPRFCANCGAPRREGAKFCAKCGTRIEV
ncbi:hypothetical protein AGMMS49983_11880 [Clostridia bacterium]|nr:hypothetical protein AGMMS49983_11880 [Clostridia bacterium]